MIMLSSIVLVIVNRIWQLFNWLCWKNVSFILQVLPSPRFACLNCIYLEVIDWTEVFPIVNLCQLGSVQPHMQLPSSSPWTEVCISSCLKTGSNLGQCSGKRNSNSCTFDTNRNPWQFSGAWHWLGAQRVSHQLDREYLHSFWLGTCRA